MIFITYLLPKTSNKTVSKLSESAKSVGVGGITRREKIGPLLPDYWGNNLIEITFIFLQGLMKFIYLLLPIHFDRNGIQKSGKIIRSSRSSQHLEDLQMDTNCATNSRF